MYAYPAPRLLLPILLALTSGLQLGCERVPRATLPDAARDGSDAAALADAGRAAPPPVPHATAAQDGGLAEVSVRTTPLAREVLALPRSLTIMCDLVVPRGAGIPSNVRAWSTVNRVVESLATAPDGTMQVGVVYTDTDDQRFDEQVDGHAARPLLVNERFDLTIADRRIASLRDAAGKPVQGERAALVRRLSADLALGDPTTSALPDRVRAKDALPLVPAALVAWMNHVVPRRFTLIKGSAEIDALAPDAVSFSVDLTVRRTGVRLPITLQGSGSVDPTTGALRDLSLSGDATTNGWGDAGTGSWSVELRTN